MMRTITLILALICLKTTHLIGQNNVIEGQVIDSLTQVSVAYAIVQIEVNKDKQTQIADSSGRFRFKNLTINQGIIQVKGLGFLTYENTFDLSKNKDNSAFIMVKLQQNVKILSEVVISDNRIIQKIDRTIYQFSEKEVKSATNTLELLSSAPLLNVDTEGGIMIKGKAGVQIFMDGKPILDERLLKTFPAELVRKVEIITNLGAEFDNTKKMSGIVNIITKTGWLGRYGSLSAQLGTNNTHNGFLFFSSKSKKIDINLTTGINTYSRPSDIEISRITQNATFFQTLEGTNKSIQPSLSLGITYKMDSIRQFNFYNNIYIPLFHVTNLHGYYKPFKPNTNADIDFFQENNNKTNNFSIRNYLDYTYEKGKSKLVLSILAYNDLSENDNNYEQKTTVKKQFRQTNASNLDEYTFQVNYSNAVSKKYTYNLGGKFITRNTSSNFQLYNIDNNSQTSIIDTSKVFNNKFSINQSISSLYFTNNVKLNRKLGTSFGVRCEYDNISLLELKDVFYILPNFTLQYAINEKQNFKIDYRKKIFRPSITYLNPFVNISDVRNNQTGNKFLLPELINDVSLSYDCSIKNHFLSFSMAYNLNNNNIQSFYELLNDNNLLIKQINLDKSKNTAFSIYHQLKVGKIFTISTNVTVDNASLYFQNITNNRWRIAANSNVAYFMPKSLTVRLLANYTSKPVLIQGLSYEYSSIELSLGKRFNDQWNVTLKARDFFKMNSIREINIYTPLFSQNDNRNLNLSVYAISATYSFGKRKYFYTTDVKINNNDLKN